MQETFEFIALMLLNYLLLGSFVAVVVFAFTRLQPFNAATRHNIWCGTLLVLVLMPALVFIPKPQPPIAPGFEVVTYAQPLWLQLPDNATTQQTGISPIPGEAIAEAAPGSFSSPVFEVESPATNFTVLQDLLTLDRVGAFLAVFIVLGGLVKLFLFALSYVNVRQLFSRAEPVDEELKSRIDSVARGIEVSNTPEVKHTDSVVSPLTGGGLLRPAILLPTDLYRAYLTGREIADSMDSLLLHELAHIKRRDPLIAMVQVLLSIFLFWHPAVYFANRQIKFERELACDDWVVVVGQTDQESGSPEEIKRAKDYAESLVTIAESMSTPGLVPHTVACVNSSNGLAGRIALLLNRRIDHSVTPNHLPNIAALSFFAGLLLISSAIWPTIPIVEARVFQDELGVPALEEVTSELGTSDVVGASSTSGLSWENPFAGNQYSEPPALNLDSLAPAVEPQLASARRFDPLSASYVTVTEISFHESVIAPDFEFPALENSFELNLDSLQEFKSQGAVPQEKVETGEFFNRLALQLQQEPLPAISNRPIEEIRVVGRATSRSVAFRIERAEGQLYDAYNALNSNDDFDIICHRRSTADELIKIQVCEPVFLKNMREQNRREVAAARNATDSAFGNFFSTLTGPRLLSDELLRYRARDEIEQVQEELIAISETNPELRAQLWELGNLQAQLSEIRREEQLQVFVERTSRDFPHSAPVQELRNPTDPHVDFGGAYR